MFIGFKIVFFLIVDEIKICQPYCSKESEALLLQIRHIFLTMKLSEVASIEKCPNEHTSCLGSRMKP